MTYALAAQKQALQQLDYLSPVGNLDAYLASIASVPQLSAEEEHALAVRLHQQQDVSAAKPLILANLRFVVRIAKGYQGYGLPFADLIQEGNIGLMKAVKRFNPTVGVRLISFAVHWIKAEIQEYVLRNFRMVKMATTKTQRKLFFNLRRMKQHLGWLTEDEAGAIASELNVPKESVRSMENRFAQADMGFDLPDDEEDTTFVAPALYLEDKRSDPAVQYDLADEQMRLSKVQQALENLKPRERSILERRFLVENKATLQSLAQEYGLSVERIRQIEQAAIAKLKAELIEMPA